MISPDPKYFKTSDPNQQVDIYEFFQFYNYYFFHGTLDKCVVRWTKRMTLCAGTCKDQGFGSSTISLSEPLLKFRSPDQLKETLLHELIHAYLFITDPQSCRIDGGHGPSFIAIMKRINQQSGLNLTVYHNFKDEVDYYRQHIWRCNGRCRDQPPFYGYVKRSMNRKPQSADPWWAEHKRTCGGQYIKISEPEKTKSRSKEKEQKKQKKKRTSKKMKIINEEGQSRDHRSWGCGKSIEDYLKEMGEESQKKNQKQSAAYKGDNSNNTSANIFSRKGKTIDELFREMEGKNTK